MQARMFRSARDRGIRFRGLLVPQTDGRFELLIEFVDSSRASETGSGAGVYLTRQLMCPDNRPKTFSTPMQAETWFANVFGEPAHFGWRNKNDSRKEA